MNRDKWLLGLLLALSALGGTAAAADRPNILFFFADDWGRNASCYRDPRRPGLNDAIATPNIDRVARAGVLFRNAFIEVPSCTPSRASVVTGSHFWRAGKRAFLLPDPGWEQVDDPGLALPGFGQLLAADGYFLGASYKTLDRDWFPARQFSAGRVEHRYGLYLMEQPDRAAARQRIEGFIRGNFREMLAGAEQSGQPFCHVFGPFNPHRPFAKGSGRELWGIQPDDLEGKLPAYWPDVPEVREDVADTLGEVLALDLYLGWMLEELEAAGHLDDTLIVLTGDNGVNLPRGKCHLYDPGVRAPLIVRWGRGIAKPGRVVDDFVSLIDLAPTFLEVAGLEPPATMDGRSLLPLLRSEASGQIDPTRLAVVTGRERHERLVRPDASPYPMRAIRTADYLYIRNFKPDRWPSGDPYDADGPSGDPAPQDGGTVAWLSVHRDDPDVKPLYDLLYGKRPAEELYDLRRDPDQMVNLADDPAHAAARTDLAHRLLDVLASTHDPRLTDDFDHPPYLLPRPAAGSNPP